MVRQQDFSHCTLESFLVLICYQYNRRYFQHTALPGGCFKLFPTLVFATKVNIPILVVIVVLKFSLGSKSELCMLHI